MEVCDHTSVGILVFKDKKLLLIERKRPPYGLAAPAGHVDSHGSPDESKEVQYEKAAIAELKEETGLDVTTLTLIAEGRKDNVCRRGSTWHYWRIYRAETSGKLDLSSEEVQGHFWCSKSELEELLASKQAIVNGREVGLESVWKEWFREIPIIFD